MENIFNTTKTLLIGLALGALSGFLSVFYLHLGEAFFRPPLFFGITVIFLAWRFKVPLYQKAWILLASYLVCYWIAFGIHYLLLWHLGLGAILLALVMHLLLKGKAWVGYLIAALAVAGIGAWLDDQFFRLGRPWELDQMLGVPNYLHAVHGNAKLAILLWQTIMMAAVAIQLQQTRQRCIATATQPAAEGGLPEP